MFDEARDLFAATMDFDSYINGVTIVSFP